MFTKRAIMMKQRARIVGTALSVLLVFLVVHGVARAASDNEFHLKPGARGKLCLKCHVDFSSKLKKKFVHTPVKSGDCTGCHNPHTSDHGKMLAASKDKICSTCHGTMISSDARSSHKPVAEGQCVLCHDPHASNYKYHLLKKGNQLCFGCHKDIAAAVKNLRVPHPPVANCLNCHDPHSSAGGKFLLKADPPALCKKCHEINSRQFTALHMGYPVQKSSCIMCHNPHGSNQKAILYNNVHPPVAQGMCRQCHNAPNSAHPFGTKHAGYQLCRGCHNKKVNKIFGRNFLHWPVAQKNGCLDCHNPHAGKADHLLKGTMLKVCGQCHSDTIRRQEHSPAKHPPIQEGKCTACHNPHSSNNAFLFTQKSVIALCGQCHAWQTHSTHPIGDKFTDPRNKNLKLNCLSCHRAHGTKYPKMLPYPTTTDLCVQCHQNLRR